MNIYLVLVVNLTIIYNRIMHLKRTIQKRTWRKFDKIIEILYLPETNTITLYELDNEKEKQEKIMELIPDILKYFSLILLML